MSSLTGSTISSTYQSLLKIDGNNTLSATLRNITDGVGNITPISMSTTLLNISTAFKLSSYGTGARTGTATYNLAVDATGNVIEVLGGGGGGTTINPTNNILPVRSNATTFVDSNIYNQVGNFLGTTFLGNDAGFYLDYSNGLYQFGDYTSANTGTMLQVDDTSMYISTFNQGHPIGIKLDFLNNNYYLGDKDGYYNGSNITIDDANKYINLYVSPIEFIIDGLNNVTKFNYFGNDIGLKLDFANLIYKFGSINVGGPNNGTTIIVDDNNSIINTEYNNTLRGLKLDFGSIVYSLGDYNGTSNNTYVEVDDANEQIKFKANNILVFQGANLQENAILTYTEKNIKVIAPDGGNYYIPLYN